MIWSIYVEVVLLKFHKHKNNYAIKKLFMWNWILVIPLEKLTDHVCAKILGDFSTIFLTLTVFRWRSGHSARCSGGITTEWREIDDLNSAIKPRNVAADIISQQQFLLPKISVIWISFNSSGGKFIEFLFKIGYLWPNTAIIKFMGGCCSYKDKLTLK